MVVRQQQEQVDRVKKISLTNSPYQTITEYLDNGNAITFTFNYRPNAFAWFVDFQYEGMIRKNIQLSSGTNILKAFKNILPIDLYVKNSNLMEEAYLQDSFALGFVELYIVDFQERDAIINGTISS